MSGIKNWGGDDEKWWVEPPKISKNRVPKSSVIPKATDALIEVSMLEESCHFGKLPWPCRNTEEMVAVKIRNPPKTKLSSP